MEHPHFVKNFVTPDLNACLAKAGRSCFVDEEITACAVFLAMAGTEDTLGTGRVRDPTPGCSEQLGTGRVRDPEPGCSGQHCAPSATVAFVAANAVPTTTADAPFAFAGFFGSAFGLEAFSCSALAAAACLFFAARAGLRCFSS